MLERYVDGSRLQTLDGRTVMIDPKDRQTSSGQSTQVRVRLWSGPRDIGDPELLVGERLVDLQAAKDLVDLRVPREVRAHLGGRAIARDGHGSGHAVETVWAVTDDVYQAGWRRVAQGGSSNGL
jgi:hypothetical protein